MNMSKTAQLAVSSLITITLVAALIPPHPVAAADTITMAFWGEPSEIALWRWGELLYTEAFRRIGVEFQYKVYPPVRASVMADAGQVDAEPARVASYGEAHPNLVRVDEWVVKSQVVAYAVDQAIALDGWESLRNTEYHIDYYRGHAVSEQHLAEVVEADRLSSVSDPIQALKKLRAGRIDMYVDSSDRIGPLLQSPEFKDSGIHAAGVMEEIFSYPYLHKRHADLAPKLAETLKQMKAEGLFAQYMQQAQAEFAQKE